MSVQAAGSGDATRRRGRTAALVVVLAVFMTNLDLWIVNVALPAMGTELRVRAAGRPR